MLFKKKLHEHSTLSILLVAIAYLLPVMGLGMLLNAVGIEVHGFWYALLLVAIEAIIFFIIIPCVFKVPNGQGSIKEYLNTIKFNKTRITIKNLVIGILVCIIVLICLSSMLSIIGKFKFDISKVIPYPLGEDKDWGIIIFLVPAIFEEISTRGIVFSILRRKFDINTVILMTSALFAVGHIFSGSIMVLAWTFLMGIIFAYVYVKTDSLFTSIVAHYLYNTFSNCLCLYDSLNNASFIESFIVLIIGTGVALLLTIMLLNLNIFKQKKNQNLTA